MPNVELLKWGTTCPTDILENLKISHNLPEVPPVAEDEIFDFNASS